MKDDRVKQLIWDTGLKQKPNTKVKASLFFSHFEILSCLLMQAASFMKVE